ncbi:hypothetical protein KR038_006073, partial [Drosophila bunnanda]
SQMESRENEPLKLLQNNFAKFIASEMKKRVLGTSRCSLKNTFQNSIRMYANNRNYLACEIKKSLPETSKCSHPAKQSRTLPKINCRQNEKPCNTKWQWSGAKYCIAPSTKHSLPQKGPSEKDLPGLVTKKFDYQPRAIKRAILRETNKYRKLHNASPLKMDDNLSNYAEAWANHLAHYDRLETRPFPIYGENIMCIRKPLFSIEHMMKLWYQEKYHHDYINPRFSPYTGHFTQMVWRNTEYLGVGVAFNDYRIWIVCNYDPPGNITGHFQENVVPRKLLFYESTDDEKKKKKNIPSYKNQLK